MHDAFHIKKIAVLGAGVMGAQIAAQCVNAGIETLLYDLSPKEGNPNGVVDKAIANLGKLKPPPLATPQSAVFLQARNYEQNLEELSSCDLIIEAIAERLDWKESLYQRIAAYLDESSILVSNTSGLSINTLASVLPEHIRAQFCGVHFFNPPRYMHLAELIPSKETPEDLLDCLETWLTRCMGKGVVRAKDRPNFIGNRIGVFSLLSIVHHTERMQMGLDEVDALTGPLLGRPKSATFRTMDVVGLDTLVHVVNTMSEQLQKDPWHSSFQLPDWFMQLVDQGHLGQKTGQGIYRKNGQHIEVFDPKSKTYQPVQAEAGKEVKAILQIPDPKVRMQALLASVDKQAQFLAACFKDLFHYCAYHLEEIADKVSDVDLAIRWGFAWVQGPFEIWQSAGLQDLVQAMEQDIQAQSSMSTALLPSWLKPLESFYTEVGSYSPRHKKYQARSLLPVYKKQFFPARVLKEPAHKMPVLYENDGLTLSHLLDDIAVLSFKSKANTMGQSVLDGLELALGVVERNGQGLIIYQNDASNFSSGMDLKSLAGLLQEKNYKALDCTISEFQQKMMRIKYSSVPIVAALRGSALGGGCALLLHCTAAVAAFESYPGLVEAGVGLIPAGGACKELIVRAAQQAQHTELFPFLKNYVQQMAMGQVASSATEAKQMGYLRVSDAVLMHADEVLYAAVAKIKALNAANYRPPLPQLFPIAGIEGKARLQAGLVNWLEGGFMSDHDYFLCTELATVLCGGNLNQGTLVDEAWILQLEKEAFLTLLKTSLTQARIAHWLKTGKPLRN